MTSNFWQHWAISALEISKKHSATFDFFCKNEACVICETQKRHKVNLVTGQWKNSVTILGTLLSK